MTLLIRAVATASLLLAGTQASAETAAERGAAKFAELTEGRVAGEPKSCVSTFNSNDIHVVENVGISYERGDTLWIARAVNPSSLRRDDIPIFERFGSQLCRQDLVRTVDRYSNFITGVVFLQDFVPYTLPEQG